MLVSTPCFACTDTRWWALRPSGQIAAVSSGSIWRGGIPGEAFAGFVRPPFVLAVTAAAVIKATTKAVLRPAPGHESGPAHGKSTRRPGRGLHPCSPPMGRKRAARTAALHAEFPVILASIRAIDP